VLTTRSRPALAGIRLVIFDLDGTLVDSKQDLALSVNAMRERLGLAPLHHEVIASYVGQGVTVLIRRALGEQATNEQAQEGLEIFLGYYREHMLDNTRDYPGVREALAELHEKKLAVLTNKPVHFSREMLERLGIAQYFSFIYGGNSFQQKKPDPVGVRKLMNDTESSPQDTLMVGDSDTDVLTGRNAGVWTCGVTYGFGAHTLESEPPDFLVGDLRDLPLLLNGAKPVGRD
jgi:phosphoglycolate phosphatase